MRIIKAILEPLTILNLKYRNYKLFKTTSKIIFNLSSKITLNKIIV